MRPRIAFGRDLHSRVQGPVRHQFVTLGVRGIATVMLAPRMSDTWLLLVRRLRMETRLRRRTTTSTPSTIFESCGIRTDRGERQRTSP
jgi:hypothetical protein